MNPSKGMKLRTLLGMLVIGSVLLTALVGGYAAVQANMASLTASYLENNEQYARKLASNTTNLLGIMEDNLKFMAAHAGQQPISPRELEIWFQANRQYFNSIFIVDPERRITAVFPAQANVGPGTRLTSEASREAVETKAPLISEHYVGATGRRLILISSPIFDGEGAYQGYVGGTIYLEENNVLSRTLSEHFYGNGSYVYVTDADGHILFHPDPKRIGELVTTNEVVRKAVSGQSGSELITNTRGLPFLAGYTYVPSAGWSIISQTPTSILEAPRETLMKKLLLQGVPLCFVILLAAWRVAHMISAPLFALAKFSEESMHSRRPLPLRMPKSGRFIYEVKQLHHSMDNHLSHLAAEIENDGLTGLLNRKSFDRTIGSWAEERVPFSLILLDIDHFKRINDTYGHPVGDAVLRSLAEHMEASTRSDDLCFRVGGEEFAVLVRHGSGKEAAELAERLRLTTAELPLAEGERITLSLGVAVSDASAGPQGLIELADQALYRSKKEGRNRTTVFTSTGEALG
ncbi:sensor domain-containing diguanylate cyclase [Paenibacillus mucilaginosus]|uniref:Transmembrane protein n=3 Tax=Paenibacillus mucilaginosus TaxID=61624 RepID=H6NNQ4_9BACL|nr:sensor domain-containing diguanylate cyclase [Paenibacillus mucilaginosus]AEI45708.1 transmembrane protein [Paenibacillus mucilaginosus KNP414]AFC33375.1 transmembrane protein [Paenibacillus mucilaginosus 3016]AFH65684.1 membrane protein [Paenibacillus mucilaginosus K02]MCG7215103.1 sensor domain-containing diguanylate cyclase [Paenibacillus mucilaginosus]WDM27098.1 GGDEF domain-containing protein [Paenibacillus mucilaginosus]